MAAIAVAWIVVATLERTVLRRSGQDGELEDALPRVLAPGRNPEQLGHEGVSASLGGDEDALPQLVGVEREEEVVEPVADVGAHPAGASELEPGGAAAVASGGGPDVDQDGTAELEASASERPAVHLAEAPRPSERDPEAEPSASQPPAAPVVDLPLRGGAGWNVWDLERRARERAGSDVGRDEEWAALFVHLREYASPDGMLPPEFDELVREAFAELIAADRA